MSWVRPGVRDVLASFPLSVKALIALDFPEFDRPAKATSEPVSGGALLIALALCKNVARRKLMGASVGSLDVEKSVIVAFCDVGRIDYNATRCGP